MLLLFLLQDHLHVCRQRETETKGTVLKGTPSPLLPLLRERLQRRGKHATRKHAEVGRRSDGLQPNSKRNLMAFVTTSFLLLLVGHLLLVAMHLLLLASCQTCSVESRGEGHEFVNCLTPLPRLDSSHLVSFL